MKINWRRYIGAWEVIGGVWGIALFANGYDAQSSADVVLATVVAVLALTSVAAGIALLRNWEFGRPLSIATQAAQVLQISAGYVGYRIVLGPYLRVWWDMGAHGGVDVGATASMWLVLNTSAPAGIAVNLVAAAALLALADMPSTNLVPSGAVAPPT